MRWVIAEQSGTKTSKNAEDILTVLLSNRGVKTKKEKEEFLNPDLEKVNIDAVGIDKKEVKKTIDRIKKAINANEQIIVYGDYDVDGICGAAILWETLFEFYKNVLPHIPHRINEGYGLSTLGIDHIIKSHGKPGLIITVDNGIVAYDAVEYANKLGIDVIITDHHVAKDELPNAFSSVHTTKLCGAGVAYLLAKEIARIQNSEFRIQNFLGLAALATVCDLVPLTGANRAIVKFGIDALRKTSRPGLLALYDQAQIDKNKIGVYEMGHIIGPRINAAGRIAHAMDSLRLICTKDPNRAQKLAQHLGQTNENRQILTKESTAHADSISAKIEEDQKFIFVHDPAYNPGIIGLVASRLVEKHYRPAVVVSVGEEISKGSARSITGFNIIEYIRTFQHFLVDAGGHPMAAGFTIQTDRLEEFKNALIEASRDFVHEDLLERKLKIDMELDFSSIDIELFENIQKLAPFGLGNSEPLFVSKNVEVENMSRVGREMEHLKLYLKQKDKKMNAIFFRPDPKLNLKKGDRIDVAYQIENNRWNGENRIELKVRDVTPNS